jgi:hypothetical protein
MNGCCSLHRAAEGRGTMTENMPGIDPGPEAEDIDQVPGWVEEFEPRDPADPEEPSTIDEEDDEEGLADPGEANAVDVAEQMTDADEDDEDGYGREF